MNQSAMTAWRSAAAAVRTIGRALGSLKLAVLLLTVLAMVLAWATVLEAGHGREVACWYIYTSPWFVGLLGLLGTNILAASALRFSRNRRHIGLAVTHVGVLVLLVGVIQTILFGVEGRLELGEGQRSDKLVNSSRSQIIVERSTNRGHVSSKFTFAPGAVDWPEATSIDFDRELGLGLTVNRFYRHAGAQVSWIADPEDYAGPALELKLLSHQGYTVGQEWLAASLTGGEAIIGPVMFVLLPVPIETMVDDFVNPPTDNLGEAGVLSVHHAGRAYRIPVDKTRGRRIPVGNDGIELEIVDYLPDARPAPNGSFVSHSSNPRNPMLELRVHLPDRAEPMRQLAFANRPLLSLDAAYGRECPLRFWYHHPQTTWVPGAVFLQTPQGRLVCRAVVDGVVRAPQEVQAGSHIPLGGQFTVSLEQHIVRARQHIRFTPLPAGPGRQQKQEAAAEIEITLAGHRQRIWLRRADDPYGRQDILTPQGVVTLAFEYEQVPLGFTIELQDVVRSSRLGRTGNSSIASRVKLLDPAGDLLEVAEISTDRPLPYGKFTLYQSRCQQRADGKARSVLLAAYDPGRFLKYLGSFMVCAGLFTMFYMRCYLFENFPSLSTRGEEPNAVPAHSDSPPSPSPAVPRPLGLRRATTQVDAPHVSR